MMPLNKPLWLVCCVFSLILVSVQAYVPSHLFPRKWNEASLAHAPDEEACVMDAGETDLKLGYLNPDETVQLTLEADEVSTVPVHITWVLPEDVDRDIQERARDLSRYEIGKLNQAFGKINLRFALHSLEVILNDNYSAVDKGTERDITLRTKTRTGGKESLNIWATMSTVGGRLPVSWAVFPWDSDPDYDGVMVYSPGWLKGGRTFSTVVHEVGHWLGLFHTFQGGCEGTDYVEDTPQVDVRRGILGCPADLSTCPGTRDMVENFMDYTSHECRDSFTPGQYDRMKWMFQKYRRH